MSPEEETLASLRQQAETARRRYFEVMGDIKSWKTQLGETLDVLRELGCPTLADAEALIAHLEAEVESQVGQIRTLLAPQ